ncbi:MAG: ATP-binding protein [Polyangiaceae bacterium]
MGNDELSELASSFNSAAEEVRRQIESQAARERSLRSFLDGTTHDLMTPLTVLTGHLSSIAKSIREQSKPELETVEQAMTEAHYIASLVHNLGAVAKLEAGEHQIRKDPVVLNELVERVVARMRPIARLREVELEYSVSPDRIIVVGDITLIEQAFSNVVQNAVKYNHAGGHVAVVLDSTKQGFLLDVIDDGPGIRPEEIPRLLLPRERGETARNRDPYGRGLGLSIARQVADTHGWTIALGESEYGGLKVSFEGSIGEEEHPYR